MKLWPFSRKSTPFSSASLAALLQSAFGGGPSKSGATVTSETALQVSVVLACLRVIAEGVAQVPFRVMRVTTKGDRTVRLAAPAHPLFDLLYRKPNRWQTSFALRETMVIHAALMGDAYAFKSRVGSDQRIKELVVLDPNRVKAQVGDDGTMTYVVTGRSGAQRTLQQDDVWHWRGPSWDGQTGMKLIRLAREAIGLAIATEESQARLHANSVRPSGVYTVTQTLTKEQRADLLSWLEAEAAGAAKAGRPMVLGSGATWNQTTMTGVDAQHLETRRHQVEEVCRMFRVLPIMAGQADKASTYASAEQMFIAHLVHTLMPWYERIEQSADCELLTDADRAAGYYTLLDGSGMLRGALKDTAEYLSKLVERGVLTRNEAREYIDRNPLDGLDEPLTPLNLLPSSDEPVKSEA